MQKTLLAVAVMVAGTGAAQAATIVGSCPFGLVAQATDGWTESNPYTSTTNWTGQSVTAVIMDELGGDGVQSGSVSIQTSPGGTWQRAATYSTTEASNAGIVVALTPAATHGVQIVADTPAPTREIWRLGHADFLACSPGKNLALGATTTKANAYGATAIGTGANPGGLVDGIDSSDSANYWRAADGPGPNYVGVTFSAPVTVNALRVDFGLWGTTWQWLNFDIQVQTTVGGEWTDVGQASAPGGAGNGAFYWIDMGGLQGGMQLVGIRLYGKGDHTTGNNPGYPLGETKIVTEMQVYGDIPKAAQ